ANLDRGGDRSKPPIGGLPVEKAAEALNVAPRQAERARVVHQHGVDEVREALDRGDVAVSVAEKIARMPEEAQPAELARHLPNGARAIMGSRQEPDDSLDYFPTPPWATRALLEHVLPQYASWNSSVWEPACGEGHIAEVLAERFREVIATDIHDYGYGGVQDFLTCQVPEKIPDWIITNPPFGDKAEAFVLHALQHARVGAAMFLRLQWLETVGRYERIFKPHPPTMIAQFAERVPLHKGRWEHDGDTATAYLWIVWSKISSGRGTEFFWIPPGCRDTFQLEDDVARFTAHPVIKRVRAADDGTPCNPETGEIIEPVDSKKPDQSISDDHYCDNNRPNKDQDADKTQGATSSLCGGPIVARSTGNSELNRSAASDNLEIPAFLKRAKDNQLPGGPA
ncbi:MAG: hypothetical protein J0H17_00695, partial [Rhizobiales bacterium]|nr:hypothetical protein [Hyphomicrobiales bacterium]